MLFAVSDAVWMAAIAAAVTIMGIVQTIVQSIINSRIANGQTTELNEASQKRSDCVVAKVEQSTEKVAEHVEKKAAEVLAAAGPQDVRLVNAEPIPVHEVGK